MENFPHCCYNLVSRYYANNDWHRGQYWGLFPEVARLLPKCRSHYNFCYTCDRNGDGIIL